MNAEQVEAEFRDSVCNEVYLRSAGLDRYAVEVPFQFEDGDHYVVLLKRSGDQWALSDEGHTLMHLAYDVPEFDSGNRRNIIDRVLTNFQITDRDGDLVLPIAGDEFGDALFSYIQALTRITDVSFLTRERVRTTFAEDFRELAQQAGREHEVTLDYRHPDKDQDGRYSVDARLNGTSAGRQVFLFAVGSDAQCRDATIIIHRWLEWGERFHRVAVFQDQTEINRVVLARFSDVADRQFSSLDTAREGLAPHITDLIG